MKMTKKMVKKMMKTIGQQLLSEGDFTLEYDQPYYGETIVFEFDADGFLCSVYS